MISIFTTLGPGAWVGPNFKLTIRAWGALIVRPIGPGRASIGLCFATGRAYFTTGWGPKTSYFSPKLAYFGLNSALFGPF